MIIFNRRNKGSWLKIQIAKFVIRKKKLLVSVGRFIIAQKTVKRKTDTYINSFALKIRVICRIIALNDMNNQLRMIVNSVKHK